MIGVADVDRRWAAIAVQVRTEFLGLPTRLKARRPEIAAADVAAVDVLIREALEALADRQGAINTEGERVTHDQ